MAISALLFDKDGTIIDYWLTWVPINREVALFAAGGDDELAVELLRAGGYDPATMRILPGSVLAAGSVDDIAGAFAAHLGSRTPDQLAAGIEAIFRQAGAQHARLVDGAGQTDRRIETARIPSRSGDQRFNGRPKRLAGAARHPRPVRFQGWLRFRFRQQARSAHGVCLLRGRWRLAERRCRGRRCAARPSHGSFRAASVSRLASWVAPARAKTWNRMRI